MSRPCCVPFRNKLNNFPAIYYSGNMRCLVFIAPREFRDETLSTVQMFFSKWGIEGITTSYSDKECSGSHGSVCRPGINAAKVTSQGYDSLLITDGTGIETYKLYDYRPLLDMIFNFHHDRKPICAIGNGVKALARANVIKDRKIAVPNDQSTKSLVLLFRGLPSQEEMEMQDNICTIRDASVLESAMPRWISSLGVK